MVGGGQIQKVDIGLNPEARSWSGPQQVGEPFGGVYGQGHLKRPFAQGFGDPSKLPTDSVSAASLDINYRDHYPPMEQRDQPQGGEGAVVEQRGVYGPQRGRQQEWGQENRAGVESNYQVAAVRGEMSASEGSQSDGSEEEEDEEDEEEEDEEDMAGNEMDDGDGDDDKGGKAGVPEQVEGISGVGVGGSLPLAHPSMGGLDHSGQVRQEHPLRVDGGFQRNIMDRDRATLKAAIGGTGTSNSPFGMFQSPSSTLPFLNSFSSPSNLTPQIGVGGHVDVTPTQNGGGMAIIASGSGATFSITRESGLSRDGTREGFRETAVVTTLQEASRVPSGSLHEQLQTTDVDNYYTTLLNTQGPPNNGVKTGDSASRRMVDPQSTAETSLRRILSDPLTGALMDDAMIISCGHSVGNAGRRRVMETSVCIICGASVRTEAMAPNYALRTVVQAFKREEEMNGNVSLRSAKRRRETVQESVALPEQAAAAAEAAKVKGVQFPFVVSDRVMIKGNKRTPERFVGREAVITTQCLNGWYLVRTMDTGESVRLQYRSLQKVGGQTPSNDAEYRPS
ncbi:hypothetical protein KC19_1G313000 [Ceratodon purpureus]|uniref:PUB 62/63 C-terminal domain-containing protein n=1 Tax=Ceratodon purpureus TaxID=3225 RepID=A0A8T0JDS0_CERPU|nr:hypothetical protein KC19_1G313000 [Ceratodon purpureus]